MSKEGGVLTAAKAKGFESLNKLAQELMRADPKLFKGVASRSLGAKLSQLNCGHVTWWRSRRQAAQALAKVIDFDVDALIDAETASRRGLWSFEEFPELTPLDLAEDEPATVYQVKALGADDSYGAALEDWFALALVRGNDHRRLTGPREGISWLSVPGGHGFSLLLARIEARRRVPLVRAPTLSEASMAVPRSGPVVLAPSDRIEREDLLHLAPIPSDQPVLVVSMQRPPKSEAQALTRTSMPSWEWLVATPTERRKLSLGSGRGVGHGGLWDEKEIREFELTLVVDWREELLHWVERRLSGLDSLFSASALVTWLDAFDPDEVFFPNPGATLSLARLCHQRGERLLPKPSQVDTGSRLLKGLGALDSRYLDLLKRLTVVAWMDSERPWDAPRPWQDWFGPKVRTLPSGKLPKPKPRSQRSAAIQSRADASAARIEGDAALKLGLLVPTTDGEYRFRSSAEASLTLRDLLLGWFQSGQSELWAAPAVGDERRQKLVDSALRGMDGRAIERLCLQSLSLEPWSCQSIGATEALFVAAGLRMAEGKLSYTPNLGRFLEALFARCEVDQGFNTFPLGRSLQAASQKLDWAHACWGWSLHCPPPRCPPEHARHDFPSWQGSISDFLGGLTWALADPDDLPRPIQSRVAPLALTAAKLVQALQLNLDSKAETTAAPALLALICLTRAVLGTCEPEPVWWSRLHTCRWASKALASVFDATGVPVSPKMAASLLEACTLPDDIGAPTWNYLSGPLWTKMLQEVEPSATFPLLTQQAYGLAISQAASLPPRMRAYMLQEAPVELLHRLAHWGVLLSSEELPSDKRLAELLDSASPYSIAVANRLWILVPERCVSWAVDSRWPSHRLLLENCPDEHALELLEAIENGCSVTPAPSSWVEWTPLRIARNGPIAKQLVRFLGRVVTNRTIDKSP